MKWKWTYILKYEQNNVVVVYNSLWSEVRRPLLQGGEFKIYKHGIIVRMLCIHAHTLYKSTPANSPNGMHVRQHVFIAFIACPNMEFFPKIWTTKYAKQIMGWNIGRLQN